MSYPATQREAFEAIQPSLGDRQQAVLDCIRRSPHGMTLFEICEDVHLQINCVSGRVTELRGMGWVRASGGYKTNPRSGCKSIVWIPARPDDRQLNLL